MGGENDEESEKNEEEQTAETAYELSNPFENDNVSLIMFRVSSYSDIFKYANCIFVIFYLCP